MAVHPVPVVIAVRIVGPNPDAHLWLSPKTRPIGASQPHIRTKVGQIELAVGAEKNYPPLLVPVSCICGRQFEAYLLGRSHWVFGAIFGPASTGAGAGLMAVGSLRVRVVVAIHARSLCVQADAAQDQ